jgi:DNA-binding IclR family transcriptional regulator
VREVRMESIRVIDRAIDILNTFTHHAPALTIDEICKASGLPKTTAYRILYTLERRGLMRFNASSLKYQLGFKFLEYGDLIASSLNLREESEEELQTLYESTHQTVLLAIQDENTLVYIFSKENREGLKVSSFEGPRRPLVFGAFGYVLMAFMDKDRLNQFLNDPIPQFTEETVTNRNLVMARLERIRQEKIWIESNEAILGVTGIAAPIFDVNKNVIAVVGINGPSIQLVGEQLESAKSAVMDAAAKISAKISYRT